MATIGGPNTEKDGLVFGYDTGYGVADNNTATRFYPGENTVNILPSGPAIGTGDFSRQSYHNESFTYSKVTNYKGRADVHKLYINPSGNTADPYADFGGQYHKSGGSAVGDVYALSLDFHVAKGINKPSLGSVYANGYKSPTSAGAASLGTSIDVDLGDGWTRRTRIATITAAGNTWWRFGCNTDGNETEVYIDNVQIELKSHATPFVDGTRSTTQSLIDLTKTTDIDVSNVSFDSTGQPTFDGTDDYLPTSFTRGTLGDVLTMIAYYKFDGNTSRTYTPVFGGIDSGGGTEFFIGKNSGNTNIGVQDGNYSGNFVQGSSAWDGNYHQIVYTYNNGIGKIYLDGILKSTGNFTKCNSAEEILIGREAEGSGYWFIGDITRACVYSKVFTAEEVLEDFNALKNRFDI